MMVVTATKMLVADDVDGTTDLSVGDVARNNPTLVIHQLAPQILVLMGRQFWSSFLGHVVVVFKANCIR